MGWFFGLKEGDDLSPQRHGCSAVFAPEGSARRAPCRSWVVLPCAPRRREGAPGRSGRLLVNRVGQGLSPGGDLVCWVEDGGSDGYVPVRARPRHEPARESSRMRTRTLGALGRWRARSPCMTE